MRLQHDLPASERQWQRVPKVSPLAEREVHVWRVRLSVDALALAHLRALLSPDERERAARFVFVEDQQRFIATRGALRSLLAHYMLVDPRDLRFQYGLQGKPALDAGCGDDALRFNLSHSHELALLAVTRGRELGVDLERVRPELACDDIAERFFAADEAAALHRFPEALRRRAFFACWTRKEAFLKAIGHGLTDALDSFAVPVTVNATATQLSTADASRGVRHWWLRDLPAGDAYAAALAIEGGESEVRCFEWAWPHAKSHREVA